MFVVMMHIVLIMELDQDFQPSKIGLNINSNPKSFAFYCGLLVISLCLLAAEGKHVK
jgi:hypothetical protein